MTASVELRLQRAILRLGTSNPERAAKLDITPRQLTEWMNGNIPDVVRRLEEAGVITINDEPQPRLLEVAEVTVSS